MKKIILASTSKYRKQLLEKTGLAFTTEKPSYDEEKVKYQMLLDRRTPLEIAEALSKGKALSINANDRLIIAGDQLVHFNHGILGKAGTFEKAFNQLKQLNGQKHELITAVTIRTETEVLHLNHITQMYMKSLSDQELKNYLKKDEPYDAAGSYKIEESGLILFEKIESDDFSAIQGLPLLWITHQLKGLGYELFKN